MKKFIVSIMMVLCVSMTAMAELTNNTAWQNEATVDSHTVSLWNFNANQIYLDGTQPYATEAIYAATNGASTWRNAFRAAGDASVGAAAGRFGEAYKSGTANTSGANYAVALAANWRTDNWASQVDPSMSVEAWVNFDTLAVQTDAQFILDKAYYWSSSTGFKLYEMPATGTNQAALHFEIGLGPGGTAEAVATTTIVPGQWYHIAGVWDASADTAYLFVNDQLIDSRVYTDGSIFNSTQDLRIGDRLGSTYEQFQGRIDDVRISDVAYNYTPEPATMSLLCLGGLALLRRNRA